MIDLEKYIRNNASRLPWLTDFDKQIKAIAGLDGVTSLVSNYSDNIYPLVMVEDVTDGFLSFEQGFLDKKRMGYGQARNG